MLADFQKADAFWADFFSKHIDGSDQELADALENCGFTSKIHDRRTVVIMPTTALLHLYDEVEGFGDNEELARRTV